VLSRVFRHEEKIRKFRLLGVAAGSATGRPSQAAKAALSRYMNLLGITNLMTEGSFGWKLWLQREPLERVALRRRLAAARLKPAPKAKPAPKPKGHPKPQPKKKTRE